MHNFGTFHPCLAQYAGCECTKVPKPRRFVKLWVQRAQMTRDHDLFHCFRSDGVGGDVVVAQSDHKRAAREAGGKQPAELSGQQRDERGKAL